VEADIVIVGCGVVGHSVAVSVTEGGSEVICSSATAKQSLDCLLRGIAGDQNQSEKDKMP